MKNKKKFLIVLFLLLTLAGCSSPRGKNGKTYVSSIITMEDVSVRKDSIDFKDEAEAKKYEDLKGDDLIEIKKTTFKDMMDEGWFDAIIVYPIAQVINFVASLTDAGVGIIATTFLIQLIVFAFSIKSQVASQKMQMIQPELQKIQSKYAGKTDERSQMAQAQEMQALYAKHGIKPFGTMLVTFIQLPIILGMYQATMRAYSVVEGHFLGISLSKTPIDLFKLGAYGGMVIFVLMLVFQVLSLKVPQWLQKYKAKKSGVKQKKYAQGDNTMANTTNMMSYTMTAMIGLLAISWPLGMSFYWLVSSIFRVIQNLVIFKFFMKDDKKGA